LDALVHQKIQYLIERRGLIADVVLYLTLRLLEEVADLLPVIEERPDLLLGGVQLVGAPQQKLVGFHKGESQAAQGLPVSPA
jgi:ABC-type uncharacterized transport system ATPase subunit